MAVDDLTQRILDSEQEFKDYPERFTVLLRCPDCGTERRKVYPKDAVNRYATEHNGSQTILSRCETCAPDNDDEDEEEPA